LAINPAGEEYWRVQKVANLEERMIELEEDEYITEDAQG